MNKHVKAIQAQLGHHKERGGQTHSSHVFI